MGFAMYGLGLVFYIAFLRESDRLARECRPHEPAEHLARTSWLTLWREHRSLYPESDLRRWLVTHVAMICIFVAGGAVLTTMDKPRFSRPHSARPNRLSTRYNRLHGAA